MLDVETKSRINTARDILVGKVPDPKSQVEQITIALIYKFMDDMDVESEELGGKRTFFVGEYAKYAWRKIFDPRQSGYELLNLYSEAIGKMDTNPGVPKLFRDIFKNAYLPYRDPETLKSFLKIINEFDYSHSEKLGDAFEYLLSVLGSQGDAGQFRTPRHIIDFMVEIVDPKKDETILDPACGTAGFLISSYKHIIRQNSSNYNPDEHNGISSNGDQSVADRIISTNGYAGDKLTADDRKLLAKNIHGYDISPDMVRLSLVNMYLHGIKDPKIYEYDTLTSEDNWHHFSDVILANPPFMSPKGGIRPHKRFSVQSNRSEVLFVDYIVEHLTANGRAAVIVPEGIIFQSGKAYKQLRKKLVEECLVGVISLPAGVFNPYAGVKTSILWLDKTLAKKTDKILFVKIENDGFDLGAQRRAIKNNDLPNALSRLLNYKDAICSGWGIDNDRLNLVKKADIGKSVDHNLSSARYVQKMSGTSSYEIKRLNELCDRITKGTTPTTLGYKFEETGVNFIKIEAITPDGKFIKNRIQHISSECNNALKRSILRQYDVLFSIAGAFGRCAVVTEDILPANTNQALAVLSLKSGVNPYYVSRMLRSEYILNEIEILKTGVAQYNVSLSQIGNIKIPVPSTLVQDEIVAEIESYQKIIDGARQVVENYKPRIDIDPEWEMVELGRLCENNDYKRRPVEKSMRKAGPYPYYGASGIVDYVDSYIFDGVFLLLSEDGANLLARSTPIAFTISGKSWVNNHAHILKFDSPITQKFVEIYLNQTDLKNFITGMAQPKLNQEAMNRIPIPLPEQVLQAEIVNKIEQEENAVNSNNKLIEAFEQKIKDRIAKVWGE